MKIHIGSPALPWHLNAKLPSVYSRGVEYATYQQGGVGRIFGVSFGHSRFYGFIVAGPFVHTENRIPKDQEKTSISLSEAQQQAQAALDKVMHQRFSNFDAGAVIHWAERGLYQVKSDPSPQPNVAGRCCWRRSSLSEAAQVFIRGLQCRAQANAKGEIGAEQVFDILDKTIVARGYLAGMAGDIASGAIGDLEAPATQTVCHDASAVPDLPVETGNTVPIFGQTERGECRLARGRINDQVSFCHGAPLVRRLRAAFLACPTAHGSPASTPLCWGGAGFKSGHAPNVRTDVNIREQRETEFYNASRNRVYPSPVTSDVSEGEDDGVDQHRDAAPADSYANDRTDFLRQAVPVHHMVSDEDCWKLDSTALDHVQPPQTNVAPVEIPGELEMFEGKLTKVVDASRTGSWRFHAHRDRDGYCDNPARGY